jgi:KUP system potassium uptake protein
MEKYISEDNELLLIEKITMKLHFWLKNISLSEERGFGLDPGNVTVEKFPLILGNLPKTKLKRIED